MNKAQNRILLGLAIAALVAIFFYQVAYATNEESYKTGYNGAFADYHCTAHDKTIAHGDAAAACDDGMDYYPDAVCWEKGLNLTACHDGYADGFAHWCASDVKGCSSLVRTGTLPDMHQLVCGVNVTCHDPERF